METTLLMEGFGGEKSPANSHLPIRREIYASPEDTQKR